MKLRPYLIGGLWAGVVLLVLLAVAVILWCVLAAAGDVSGANVARVLALLLGASWLLDLAGLVGMLTLLQIAALSGEGSLEDEL